MKQHAFKWKLDRVARAWRIHDPITDAVLATLDFSDHVADGMTEPAYIGLAYGIKQLASDGGAKQAGTTQRTRLAGVIARFNAWHAGTYAFRDGTGTPGGFPDADVYRALVAIGRFSDRDENRDKWRKLSPAVRAAQRLQPDVAAWLVDHVPTVDEDTMAEAMSIFS